MRIPDTRIEVDDFRQEDASLHVLTHYHADHRQGLRPGDSRPILCSSLTAKLLTALHGVPISAIRRIDPGERRELAGGTTVSAFEANHCPGAIMLRFDVAGRRHLHTGDFRYAPAHDRHPELFDAIDTLFVDATYESGEAGEAAHEHPTQEAAIDRVVELIESHPHHVVDLGVYLIGKNRVVAAIHERLGVPVYMPSRYRRIYQLLGLGACVTRSRRHTRVHGIPMGSLRRWHHLPGRSPGEARLVIVPTGWKRGRGRGDAFHYVPYSEHSSTSELAAFIAKVGARRVVRLKSSFP